MMLEKAFEGMEVVFYRMASNNDPQAILVRARI